MRIPSSDHVNVAVHDLGGTGRPLLIAHATGFHGYCYLPMADALQERFRSYAIDIRGFGDTARPAEWRVDWRGFGDDAEAVATALAPSGGLVGFGHSMGGAALLMAALRRPELFDLVVAFEPIVFPPRPDFPSGDRSPIGAFTRKRRASFPSFEAAIENYESKPPMNAFDPDVLRLYVAHGFRAAPEGVRLKCDPEHEARTYEASVPSPIFDQLPELTTRVVVIGSGDGDPPATMAPRIADLLPAATFVRCDDMTHFGPFVDPQGVATIIAEAG